MSNYQEVQSETKYALDYPDHVPGVLDLSKSSRRSKKSAAESPQISINQDSCTSSPLHLTQQIYRGSIIPIEASSSNTYNRSSSLYSAEGREISGQTSPNYASCYPGTEHLSPLIIQAAFRQQVLLQSSTLPDPEVLSEEGSEGSNCPFGYPLAAPGRDGKVTRPFKAYPKDPMSLAAGFASVDAIIDTQSAEKYSIFRKKMMDQICAANGGQATVTNPKMRRTMVSSARTNNNSHKADDSTKQENQSNDSYGERRKKNNAAAKKSRDRRRIKEDEIAIRAAYLERENVKLKLELAAYRKRDPLCAPYFRPNH